MRNQIKKELLLDNSSLEVLAVSDSVNQNLRLDMSIKDLGLLRAYVPSIPNLKSNMDVRSSIAMNNRRLLFNASISDTVTKFNAYELDSLRVQITGNFRAGEQLKESAGLQVEATAKTFTTEMLSGNNLDYSLQMDDDSILVRTEIERIGAEPTFSLKEVLF